MPAAAEVHRQEVEVGHPPGPPPPGVGPVDVAPLTARAPDLALEAVALPAEAAVGIGTGPEIAATTAAAAGPGRQGRPADGPAVTRPAAGGDAATAAATAAAAALPVVAGAAALVHR